MPGSVTTWRFKRILRLGVQSIEPRLDAVLAGSFGVRILKYRVIVESSDGGQGTQPTAPGVL